MNELASNLSATEVTGIVDLVEIAPQATVSRTVLKAEGVRIVIFAFDAGQELTEHTAAVPVLLEVLTGRLAVEAAGQRFDLAPGAVLHLGTRTPHTVVALAPSRLKLTMLDVRQA